MPRAKRSDVNAISPPETPAKKSRTKRTPESPAAAWMKSRGHEPFDFQRAERRTAVSDILSVRLRQRVERQTQAHILLIARMNVYRVANVDRDGHAGIRQRSGAALSIAQTGPVAFGERIGVAVVGQLDEVKGKVALFPVFAPVANHAGKENGVASGVIGVRFALVPDCAANREGNQGADHAVVKRGRGVGVHRRLRFRRFRFRSLKTIR